VIESYPTRLLALVLGPAGPTGGERTDERDREDGCDASPGNSVDGSIGDEREGGREEEKVSGCGMDGRRRLLVRPFGFKLLGD